MGVTSAGRAAAELDQAKPARSGGIRDIRLDGHFGRGNAQTQVDFTNLRLDGPDLDPDLKAALAYWNVKRGPRLAPTRGDIDPVEIAALLSRVMLVDVSTDPLDFRYRLAGTGTFKVYGAEITNKRPLDLEPPVFAALVHRLYSEAVAQRVPVAHRVQIECRTRRSTYVRIILPLSDDGATVNRLMTVASYPDSEQELRDCFEEARLGATR